MGCHRVKNFGLKFRMTFPDILAVPQKPSRMQGMNGGLCSYFGFPSILHEKILEEEPVSDNVLLVELLQSGFQNAW